MHKVKFLLISLLAFFNFIIFNIPTASASVGPGTYYTNQNNSAPYNFSNPANGFNTITDLTKLAKIDSKNLTTTPKVVDFTKIPNINIDVAAQLIKSDVIAKIFMDQDRSTAVLVTKEGVQFLLDTTNFDLLLPMITEKNTSVKYVKFVADQSAPKNGGGNPWLVWVVLFFIVNIILFSIRDKWMHKYRYLRFLDRFSRKVKVGDDQVKVAGLHGADALVPITRFSDVAGCNEAIEDLQELAEFLKNPEKFDKMGAKVPHGAILVGPPGTGKTLLARAVAGEAGVPFFSAVGSDFVEMYVGVGASRVRDLFKRAQKHEKAIIFIDEIDSIARRRSGDSSGGGAEHDQTINALLHEMDGFKKNNIIVIGATNRIEILDDAILRPGRLDRKIQVPLPDRRGREEILKVHARNKLIAEGANLSLVARRTPGMSGAELEQVLNEAAIEAVRKDKESIDDACLSDAIALVAMGRARKSAVVTDHDRLITAWHEAGHTVTALLHPDAAEPVSVSITPRGHAGGITWMSGSDDLYLKRKTAVAQLIVSMGGRAAEEYHMDGEFTQGPSSDLAHATNLAKAMVHQYGMTRHGLMVQQGSGNGEADKEVIEEILNAALNDARELIEKNIGLMNILVDRLLVEETLESDELQAMLKDYKKGMRNSIFTLPLSTLNILKNVAIAPVVKAKKIVSKSGNIIKGGISQLVDDKKEVKAEKKKVVNNKKPIPIKKDLKK